MRTSAAGDPPDLDITAPLTTDQDVLRRIDWLVDQHSRRNRTLWLLFLTSDGVLLPVVVPIDGVPEWPDPQFVGNICFVIADVLAHQAPGGTAVVVLTRPGSEAVNDSDRYWLRTIHGAARGHGVHPDALACNSDECLPAHRRRRRVTPILTWWFPALTAWVLSWC